MTPAEIRAAARVGDPALPALGPDIHIRSDLPHCRMFRGGLASGTPTDIRALWRPDLVPFAVGCSLSFEADLMAAGVAQRCHGAGVTCSTFDSAIPATPAGPFRARLAGTMRAVRAADVRTAVAVTRAHPQSHGAPVHIGEPAAIGVDLARPVDGIGLTDLRPGEAPLFRACGVTMERAIAAAAPDLAIADAPAHMPATDLRAGAPAWR